MINRIEKLKPDLIIYTGDIVDSKSNSDDAIINFLNLYNVKPIFDESYKLTDIGSIIPITEQI